MMKSTKLKLKYKDYDLESESSDSLDTYDKLIEQRVKIYNLNFLNFLQQRADDKSEIQAKLKLKLQKQERFRNDVREQIKQKQERLLGEREREYNAGIMAKSFTKFESEQTQKMKLKSKQQKQRQMILNQIEERRNQSLAESKTKYEVDSMIISQAQDVSVWF